MEQTQVTQDALILEIHEEEKRFQRSFLRLGELLLELKSRNPDNWEKIVEDNFTFSIRHAYTLMQVYKANEKLPTSAILDLSKLIELLRLSERYRDEFVTTFQPEIKTVREIRANVSQFKKDKGIGENEASDKSSQSEENYALGDYWHFKRLLSDLGKDKEVFLDKYKFVKIRLSVLKKNGRFNNFPTNQIDENVNEIEESIKEALKDMGAK